MITASIVGATGFTGGVLTDILGRHPEIRLEALTSVSYAGKRVAEVFPHIRSEGRYVPYEASRVAGSDIVFVCYPHTTSHPVVAELVDLGHRVIDFSADFRLSNPALYEEWYGFKHDRTDLVDETVYGLPELHRAEIRDARLVANPGCFPTGMLLGILPLARRLASGPVIADAKSGVSGAGRAPSPRTHFSEVNENFRAYNEVGHRHTPEMVQELSVAAGKQVPVCFTPHLLPLDRGILTTLYLRPDEPVEEEELYELYREHYASEPFVEIVDATPSLREVQGTNYCRLALRADPASGLIKVVSCIDNLVKGASGQAVQNMNIMYGFPDTLGLEGKA